MPTHGESEPHQMMRRFVFAMNTEAFLKTTIANITQTSYIRVIMDVHMRWCMPKIYFS